MNCSAEPDRTEPNTDEIEAMVGRAYDALVKYESLWLIRDRGDGLIDVDYGEAAQLAVVAAFGQEDGRG